MKRVSLAFAVSDYPSLYAWSLQDPELFWAAVWRFCGIVSGRKGQDRYIFCKKIIDPGPLITFEIHPLHALVKPGDYRIDEFSVPLKIVTRDDLFPTDFSWLNEQSRPRHRHVFSEGIIRITLLQKMKDRELLGIPLTEFSSEIYP